MDKIICSYIDASINYGIAQKEGNSRVVNKNSAKLRKLRKTINENWDLYAEELKLLLSHEDDYVRLKASYDLLPICTQESLNVLRELETQRGLIGFEAEMLIEQWEKGILHYN